jgi:hypothetical protein
VRKRERNGEGEGEGFGGFQNLLSFVRFSCGILQEVRWGRRSSRIKF